MDQPSVLGTFDTLTKVYFQNGTETYATNNIRFTIDNEENKVYYQTLSKYVDKADINFTITIHNSHNSGTFACQRYSTYPYPWIILEDLGGNELTTISTGQQIYVLRWHGTETEGEENRPTIQFAHTPAIGGTVNINDNTWVENWIMIQEGDDEYFRNEYEVKINSNLSARGRGSLTITITDAEGWHDSKIYQVM